MIKIKTEREIALIHQACLVTAKVLNHLKGCLRPGIATEELDQEAAGLFNKLGVASAFKGYRGYPANICISINEEVVHGIPGERIIQEGDIVSLDVGAKLDGYFGDIAWTFPVGRVSAQTKRLLRVGQEALARGIACAYARSHLFDISSAIQRYVESCGYSVVRKFVGHGIGSQMHEDPEIPNFGQPGEGPILQAGMVLAIEPMVTEGTFEVEILEDQWTAVTKDKKLAVHFEHTVCITNKGPKILTALGI